MPAAARRTDPHTCRRSSGGKIEEGARTVFIEDLPAARRNDACKCADGASHLGSGSRTVFIEDEAAARVNDTTCHHGVVTKGARTVEIGDAGSGAAPAPAAPASAMTSARANGAPFLRA